MRIAGLHLSIRSVAPILVALTAASRPTLAGPGAADPSGLPDIQGVHLGMPLAQAYPAFQKSAGVPIGAPGQGTYMLRAASADSKSQMAVDVTPLPNVQAVWHVGRLMQQPNVNRAVLLAALRQKYGKETLDISDATLAPTTDDSAITQMFWVMDEQGHAYAGKPPIINHVPFGCVGNFGHDGTQPTTGARALSDFCAKNFVGVFVDMNAGEIIKLTQIDIVDFPLLVRSLGAAQALAQDQNRQRDEQNRKKAQEVKPAL